MPPVLRVDLPIWLILFLLDFASFILLDVYSFKKSLPYELLLSSILINPSFFSLALSWIGHINITSSAHL